MSRGLIIRAEVRNVHLGRYVVHRFMRFAFSTLLTLAVLSAVVLSASAELIGPH